MNLSHYKSVSFTFKLSTPDPESSAFQDALDRDPLTAKMSPAHARRILNRAYNKLLSDSPNPFLAALVPESAPILKQAHSLPRFPLPPELFFPLLDSAQSDGSTFSPTIFNLPSN